MGVVMAKGKVLRRAPYIIAVSTDTAGIQFVKEVQDQGLTRQEFCQRPHEATRFTTKKAASQVCKKIPDSNYPVAFTMDYAMGLVAVIAISPKESNVPH